MLDPMHGNTKKINNMKTRDFKDILHETSKFFRICQQKNVYVGGIHLEITAEDKSAECVGGLVNNDINDVQYKYNSKCDPRLNKSQCIEYIFLMCKYHEIL
jgi:3-deoxy-7-phosphoheptulonate synthase